MTLVHLFELQFSFMPSFVTSATEYFALLWECGVTVWFLVVPCEDGAKGTLSTSRGACGSIYSILIRWRRKQMEVQLLTK